MFYLFVWKNKSVGFISHPTFDNEETKGNPQGKSKPFEAHVGCQPTNSRESLNNKSPYNTAQRTSNIISQTQIIPFVQFQIRI